MTKQTEAYEKARKKSLKLRGEMVVVYQDMYSNYCIDYYNDFEGYDEEILVKFLDGVMIEG